MKRHLHFRLALEADRIRQTKWDGGSGRDQRAREYEYLQGAIDASALTPDEISFWGGRLPNGVDRPSRFAPSAPEPRLEILFESFRRECESGAKTVNDQLQSFQFYLRALRDAEFLSHDVANEWQIQMQDVLMTRPNARPKAAVPPKTIEELFTIPSPSNPPTIEAALADNRVFDGQIRLIAAELYADRVEVKWEMAEMPSYQAVLNGDYDGVITDARGLGPDGERDLLGSARFNRVVIFLRGATFSDDMHTSYNRPLGGASGGETMTGEWKFSPAPPAEARLLTVTLPPRP